MDDETATWTQVLPGGSTLHVRAVRLEVTAGPDQGLARTFSAQTIVIGRANADLQLEDKRVSALHAEITLESVGFRLRDLGSTNGTHVGGFRVVEGYLRPGTIISLGDTAIRFTPLASSNELPLAAKDRLGGLRGASAAMRRVYELIERYARTEATVLVTGEAGTGKALAAEALHAASRRRDRPFVVLDCAGLPTGDAAEAQLTDAISAAASGTLFLDEIGELSMPIQLRLQRVLDDPARDVRIVASTHRELAVEVNRERFRAELYFRLAVARVHLPPLRERREDIDTLIDHFAAASGGGEVPAEFRQHAASHPWPGNVRELRAATEQAIVLGRRPDLAARVDISVPFKEAKRQVLEDLERRYITELLDAHDGNISAAARAADLDRMTIYKFLRRAGLRDDK